MKNGRFAPKRYNETPPVLNHKILQPVIDFFALSTEHKKS